MGNLLKIVAGLLMAFSLTACGGDAEADVRDQIEDLGFGEKTVDCVLDELRDKAGSLDEFADLGTSEQRKMAARAGAACAKTTSIDDVRDMAEDLDLDISSERAQTALLEGLTSQGMPRKQAQCIVDKAVERNMELTDFLDQATMQDLVAACP